MPWANNAEIDALRMKFNLAVTAHQSCARALRGADTAGIDPPPELNRTRS